MLWQGKRIIANPHPAHCNQKKRIIQTSNIDVGPERKDLHYLEEFITPVLCDVALQNAR